MVMDVINPVALQEQHESLLNKVKAIAKIAKDEKRELTDEENAAVDDILDVQIPQVKAKIDRAKKIEAEAAHLAKVDRNTQVPLQLADEQDDQQADDRPLSARISIPLGSRFRYGNLRCFKGPDADKKAYIAGRFFAACFMNHGESQTFCNEHGIGWRPQAAMGEKNNSTGGVLVPEEVEQAIIDLKETYGVFRREARNVPMMSDTTWQPRRASGVTAYFIAENPSAGITASDPSFDNIRLVVKDLAVLVQVSNQLNEDAFISIGDYITGEIAYAFALKEDQCGFLGDASTTYGGIQGLINAVAAGSTVTAATGNTAFSTLDLTDFESMVGKLPTYAEGNAKWYISKPGWAASMMRLADAAGGNTSMNIGGGPPVQMFLGYPVVFAQVMNSTLTAQTSTDGLCYFGNLQQAAAFGNRRGMSLLISEHRYMEFNQIGIRAVERFDINVHEVGDATTAGSIIMLSTPGA